MPLGIHDGQAYEEATIALESGDLLLLFTDGITEATSLVQSATAGAQFGTRRLDKLLLDCLHTSTDECLDRIRREVAAFCENVPPTDDQTLIAIRCR